MLSFRHYEAQHCLTLTNHADSALGIMNSNRFNGLSESEQAVNMAPQR